MTAYITRRREVDAIQIPDVVGHNPASYDVALVPVVEFLTRHDVEHHVAPHGETFNRVRLDDSRSVLPRGSWLVWDTSNEGNDLHLFDEDEFPERFLTNSSWEDSQRTFNRVCEVIVEGVKLREHKDLAWEEFAQRLAGDLAGEDLLAHDDARDIADVVLEKRDTLIDNVLTVWQAVEQVSGGGPVSANVLAVSAVGTLIDTLHGREWSAPETAPADEYAVIDAAVRAYPAEAFASPVVGWIVARDRGDDVEVITSVETTKTQLRGMTDGIQIAIETESFS